MRRSTFTLQLLAATALLTTASPGSAQSLARDTAQAHPSLLALGLDSGSTIRVDSRDGGELEGQLVRITDSVIVLGVGERERSIAFRHGDTLWVQRRGTMQGAKSGAAVAMGTFGMLTAVALSTCKDGTDDPCSVNWSLFVPAVARFVGISALTGAAIGTLFPRWHRRAP